MGWISSANNPRLGPGSGSHRYCNSRLARRTRKYASVAGCFYALSCLAIIPLGPRSPMPPAAAAILAGYAGRSWLRIKLRSLA